MKCPYHNIELINSKYNPNTIVCPVCKKEKSLGLRTNDGIWDKQKNKDNSYYNILNSFNKNNYCFIKTKEEKISFINKFSKENSSLLVVLTKKQVLDFQKSLINTEVKSVRDFIYHHKKYKNSNTTIFIDFPRNPIAFQDLLEIGLKEKNIFLINFSF